MANPAPVPHTSLSAGPVGLSSATSPAAMVKRPRTPPVNTPPVDYQSADSEHLLKRSRPVGQPGEEVSYHGTNHLQCLYSQDDLPKTVAQTLNQGSSIMSMDFHPLQPTVLLDCNAACGERCKEASRHRICLRACGTCCAKCNFVPPGTSGNTDLCPCYANLTTHGNRHKCP